MTTIIIVLIIILVLIYFGKGVFESFDNIDTKSLKLLIFVSDTCPHCVTYMNNNHADVIALSQSKGIQVQKIKSGDPNAESLFNKYNVQFIPTCLIIKDDIVYKNLGSNISPQSIKSALNI